MGRRKYSPYAFLAIDEKEWSVSRYGFLRLWSRWAGGWIGPRAGLDASEKRKISLVMRQNKIQSTTLVTKLVKLQIPHCIDMN
jgi:hypothetical protein